MRVIVVGAGVVGLSVAVRLAESGHEVGVLARDLPPETTSAVAAALWYPYRALPRDAVLRWSATTYAELARLAETHPESGAVVRWGTELIRGPVTAPWWRAAVPRVEALDVPPDGFSGGWRLPVPVADMSVYLPWLVGRLEALGGTLTRTWLPALPLPSAEVAVVNCTGLAARAIAADPSLVPVRGQVVLVEQPGITEWLLEQSDEERLTYVVPRERVVVVGGTAQVGAYDPRPDPATADEILARARVLVPELRNAKVVGHRVGLRPGRPSVRLEAEPGLEGTLVHCYGHGGAGVTLSWGCADDVAALVGRPAAAPQATEEAPA
ncbi:MAG: NAD(P)/FAD-dependent oxidoreductase [Actinomycetes bacterium]